MSLDRPGFAHSWQDGDVAVWNAEAGDFRPLAPAALASNVISSAAGIVGTELAADAAAPAADQGALYFRDNGSGKTQLVVRFATGAVQVVATQP